MQHIPFDQHPHRLPMKQSEYRAIIRSLFGRILLAVGLAVLGVILSMAGKIPFGMVPTAIVGLACGYGIGGKFFPDSSSIMSRRFRNYRRVQKGLEPLDLDDEIIGSQFDDYRRG